jgi:predicted nucleic acid-binding protein
LANEPVLVDTSYWIEYFNRPQEERARKVEALIRDDRAALTGVVLAELLQGAKIASELSLLRTALAAVRWVETGNEAYVRAGSLGFALRRRGVTVPVTNCIIAAAAESLGGHLLTLDAHFEELAREGSLILLKS